MNYYCKKCGQSYDAWTIANCGCSKGGKHDLYRGMQQGPKYECAKCGYSYDFWTIANGNCSRGGKHEVL